MGTTATIRLTPRDVDILLMIYRFDGCISTQIQRRFWPQIGARSAYYDRLGRLIAAGFIRRVALPSVSGYGSGPSLLTLGARAHPILTELLDLRSSDLRQLRTRLQPAFWTHDAAVRDIHLDLEMACSSQGVELIEWINERDLKRTPIIAPASTRRTAEVVPDGAFTLRLANGASQPFYLEYDRATVPPTRLRPKLQTYLRNAIQDSRPVLWIVPSPSRRAQLVEWVSEAATNVPQADTTIIWIALRSAVTATSILSQPIWQVVGGPAAVALLPSSSSEVVGQSEETAHGKGDSPWTLQPS